MRGLWKVKEKSAAAVAGIAILWAAAVGCSDSDDSRTGSGGTPTVINDPFDGTTISDPDAVGTAPPEAVCEDITKDDGQQCTCPAQWGDDEALATSGLALGAANHSANEIAPPTAGGTVQAYLSSGETTTPAHAMLNTREYRAELQWAPTEADQSQPEVLQTYDHRLDFSNLDPTNMSLASHTKVVRDTWLRVVLVPLPARGCEDALDLSQYRWASPWVQVGNAAPLCTEASMSPYEAIAGTTREVKVQSVGDVDGDELGIKLLAREAGSNQNYKEIATAPLAEHTNFGPVQFTSTLPGLGMGQYELKVVAVDTQGAESACGESIQFKVNKAPTECKGGLTLTSNVDLPTIYDKLTVKCTAVNADCPDGSCFQVKGAEFEVAWIANGLEGSCTLERVGNNIESLSGSLDELIQGCAGFVSTNATVRVAVRFADNALPNESYPTSQSAHLPLGNRAPTPPSVTVSGGEAGVGGEVTCRAKFDPEAELENDIGENPVSCGFAKGTDNIDLDNLEVAERQGEPRNWTTEWKLTKAISSLGAKKGHGLRCGCVAYDKADNPSVLADSGKATTIVANTPPTADLKIAARTTINGKSHAELKIDYFDADIDDPQTCEESGTIVYVSVDGGPRKPFPCAELQQSDGSYAVDLHAVKASPGSELEVKIETAEKQLSNISTAPSENAPGAKWTVPNELPKCVFASATAQPGACNPGVELSLQCSDPDYHPAGVEVTATPSVAGTSQSPKSQTALETSTSETVSFMWMPGQIAGPGALSFEIAANDKLALNGTPISAQQTAGFAIPPLPYCTPAPSSVAAKCNLAAGKCTCDVVNPAGWNAPVAPVYAWSIGGVLSKTATSTILLPAGSLCAAVASFDVVCSAQLVGTAPISGGAPLPSAWIDSAPTTLSNLPPNYAGAVTVVGEPVEGNALFCSAPASGFADDHNASANFDYQWVVTYTDGTVGNFTSPTLPATATKAFAEVQCAATPHDGCQPGVPVWSAKVKVLPKPCNVTISLSSQNFTMCTPSVKATVLGLNGCQPQGSVNWYVFKSGQTQESVLTTGPDLNPGALVAAGLLKPWDQVVAVHTPYPGAPDAKASQPATLQSAPLKPHKVSLPTSVPPGEIVEPIVEVQENTCGDTPIVTCSYTVNGFPTQGADASNPCVGPVSQQCGDVIVLKAIATAAGSFATQQHTATTTVEQRTSACFPMGSTGAGIEVPVTLGQEGEGRLDFSVRHLGAPADEWQWLLDMADPGTGPSRFQLKVYNGQLFVLGGGSAPQATGFTLPEGEFQRVAVSWSQHPFQPIFYVRVSVGGQLFKQFALSKPAVGWTASPKRAVLGNDAQFTGSMGACFDEIVALSAAPQDPVLLANNLGAHLCQVSGYWPILGTDITNSIYDATGLGRMGTMFGGWQDSVAPFNECWVEGALNTSPSAFNFKSCSAPDPTSL